MTVQGWFTGWKAGRKVQSLRTRNDLPMSHSGKILMWGRSSGFRLDVILWSHWDCFHDALPGDLVGDTGKDLYRHPIWDCLWDLIKASRNWRKSSWHDAPYQFYLTLLLKAVGPTEAEHGIFVYTQTAIGIVSRRFFVMLLDLMSLAWIIAEIICYVARRKVYQTETLPCGPSACPLDMSKLTCRFAPEAS